MDNNTYLLVDRATGQSVAVDPSFGSEEVLEALEQNGWNLTAIWLTHAHFDHIAGVKTLVDRSTPPLPVGLHPEDLPLWKSGGGGGAFGFQMDPRPDPEIAFAHGQVLALGSSTVEVRHCPGHTPGHVIFYSAEDAAALCGDVIFYHGIGRTDLAGGSHAQLIDSIRGSILTLPPGTRLLSGHGPATTVEEEARANPFL
jgi:glyoxylase-like metal-dependent hydrolase (beta-lactamase superfamily II)